MESKVFLFFSALISRIAMWFDESVCGRMFKKFSSCVYKEYKTSYIRKFFQGTKRENVFSESLTGKLFSIPAKILLFMQKKLSSPLNRILEESKVCVSVSKWADVSVRIYGIVLATYSILILLLSSLEGIKLLFGVAILIFGILMILINRSIRQIFSGSYVVKALGELFTEVNFEERDFIKCTTRSGILSILFGGLLAFLSMTLGAFKTAVLVFGVLGFAFYVKYLSLGVFLTVALAPVLPTMVLVALSFLCAFVFCIHVIKNKEFTFAKNPMNVAVIFFAISLVLGCINSCSFISSTSQALVHLSFIMFYFIVINVIRTKKQWMALVKIFVVSGFVVALYGVLQNFIGVNSTESWLDEEMFQDIKVRVYSFFNNPNVLGEFLVITIPLTVAIIWGKIRHTHKTFYGLSFLSMVACMIFTWSRGAWLGMFLALALFFVIMEKRWVFFGMLALLLMPVILVLSGNSAILERILSVGNTSDTSTAYRVSIWVASFNMIKDFCVSGIGIGSEAFKVVYPKYALSGADFALHAHNLYLQVWVEMGLVGIISLLSVVLTFIRQTFSEKVISVRKKDNYAKLVIAIGAGFLGFMFQGLTDYVWYNYKMLMIFWTFIALGISGVNTISEDKEDPYMKGGSIL